MTKELDKGMLVGHWMHSHEEDVAGARVFRRADYPFPRSRGRVGFEFAADGKFVEIGIGATDRPTRTPGHWVLDPDGCRIILKVGHGAPARELRILSLEADKLVLAQ
jgi:hypothetical protein